MDNKIFEELPARNIRPAASPVSAKKPAAAQSNTSMGDFREKASQLASDVRYKSKKNKTTLQQEWQNEMRNSQAPMQVKMLAKRMLFGKGISEEYGVDTSVTNTVANALYKVFVEGLDEVKEDSEISEDMDAIKYEVRVTYKDTGKTEIHLWTRDLINKKRENPNIQHIEMVGRPIVRKKRGSSLDPYNKSTGSAGDGDINNNGVPDTNRKKDPQGNYLLNRRKKIGSAIQSNNEQVDPYNKSTGSAGDGDINNNGVPDTNRKKDPQGNYLLNRRKKIGSAIQSNNEQFDMLEAKSKNTKLRSKTDREVGVMPRNKTNNVTVFPDSKVQEETGYSKFLEMVNEKAESEQQQKLFGLALSVKRGETPRSEASAEVLKIVDTMSEKKIRDFAKTKHEELPVRKEETECGSDSEKKDGEEDPRSMKTKVNLVKNKLRAMGLKMSYEPEGEVLDERRREDKEAGTPRKPRDKAFELVAKSMGAARVGVKPRGQKKEPGKKPPVAGEYGSERRSPEQIVKNNRAIKKQGQENMSSRFD